MGVRCFVFCVRRFGVRCVALGVWWYFGGVCWRSLAVVGVSCLLVFVCFVVCGLLFVVVCCSLFVAVVR